MWPRGDVSMRYFRLTGSCLLWLLLGACDSKPAALAEPAGGTVPDVSLHSIAHDEVRVVLLGAGTPIPHPDRSRPATAVIAGGRAYLVDLGSGVVQRANEANLLGIEALDVSRLAIAFVTHLHSDHTTGYPDLILTTATLGRREPLQVFGPPGLRSMTDHILAAYEEDIRQRPAIQADDPGTRVEVIEIAPGKVYEDLWVEVTAFRVAHGNWPQAFGYRFDTRKRSIVISGDTAPSDSVVDACTGCDVLVHEVYCAEGMQALSPSPEFEAYNRAAHTSAVELGQIASRARPRLLVLTHQLRYGCSAETLLRDVRKNFSGDVVIGEDLEVY